MNRVLSDGGKKDANCKKREITLYSIKSHVNFQYGFAIIPLLLFVSFQTGLRLWKGKLHSASFASSKNFFPRKNHFASVSATGYNDHSQRVCCSRNNNFYNNPLNEC